MKIVWVGFHEVGLYAFERFVKNDNYKILSFFTLNDVEFSKRSAGSRRYIDVCKKHQVPVHYISHINDIDSYELLASYEPDIMILIGWSQIVGKKVLDLAKIGVIGGHSSLLPYNKGNSPINWSIIRNEDIGGMTLMFLDETIDGGKIISQLPFYIEFYDTCKTLYTKASELIYIQLFDVLKKISINQLTPMIQPIVEEPLLPRRKPKDGLIDWEKTSLEIYNLIRAITKPYPCAFSYYNKKKVTFVKASYLDLPYTNFNPGEILGYSKGVEKDNCGVIIACASGLLILNEFEYDNIAISGYDTVNYFQKGKKFTKMEKEK